ncbi:MAG TPA: hypothetical protein VIN08_03830 [Ohtaekwangia sp.]|uniref:hypothetical protein n=1 Tax=Ohtaekwangia sp. TaxID=2066019 RepID=UPI002F94FFB9
MRRYAANIIPRNILIAGLIILLGVLTYHAWITLREQEQRVQAMKHYYSNLRPSLDAVQSLILMTNESKMLATNWVYLAADAESKNSLRQLQQVRYPALKEKLLKYSIAWNDHQRDRIQLELLRFDTLIAVQENGVMANLITIDNYEDPLVKLLAEDAVESAIIPRANTIIAALTPIAAEQQAAIEAEEKAAIHSAIDHSRISSLYLVAGITLSLFCLITSLFIVKSVSQPTSLTATTAISADAAIKKIRIIEWIASTSNEDVITQIEDVQKSTTTTTK